MSKLSASHLPPPQTMLLMRGTFTVVFILTFIVGRGGLKCLEENRFAKISPVLNIFLKIFVPYCFCFRIISKKGAKAGVANSSYLRFLNQSSKVPVGAM